MPQGIDDFTIVLPELTDMATCGLETQSAWLTTSPDKTILALRWAIFCPTPKWRPQRPADGKVVGRKVHDLAVDLGVSAAKRSYFFLMRSSSFLRSFSVIGVRCVSPADTALGFPFLSMRVLRHCALAWLAFLPPMTCVRQHWYFYQETAVRSRTPSLTFNRYIGSEVSASPEAEPKETFNGKTPSSSCDVVPCDTSSCSIPASEQPNISPYPRKTIRCRIFPCQEYWHVCVPEEPAERGPTAEG